MENLWLLLFVLFVFIVLGISAIFIIKTFNDSDSTDGKEIYSLQQQAQTIRHSLISRCIYNSTGTIFATDLIIISSCPQTIIMNGTVANYIGSGTVFNYTKS